MPLKAKEKVWFRYYDSFLSEDIEDIATMSFFTNYVADRLRKWWSPSLDTCFFFSFQAPTQVTKFVILKSKNLSLLTKFYKKNSFLVKCKLKL